MELILPIISEQQLKLMLNPMSNHKESQKLLTQLINKKKPFISASADRGTMKINTLLLSPESTIPKSNRSNNQSTSEKIKQLIKTPSVKDCNSATTVTSASLKELISRKGIEAAETSRNKQIYVKINTLINELGMLMDKLEE